MTGARINQKKAAMFGLHRNRNDAVQCNKEMQKNFDLVRSNQTVNARA